MKITLTEAFDLITKLRQAAEYGVEGAAPFDRNDRTELRDVADLLEVIINEDQK